MNFSRLIVIAAVLLALVSSGGAYTLSGEISGAEWFGGITYVYALSLDVTNPGFYLGLALLGNGAYFILNVPEGSYILTAFQDRDGNLTPSIDDYMGYYGGAIPQTVEVAGNVNNLDIAVAPLPFTGISGLVSCPAGQYGLTYLLAASDPLFEEVVNTGILLDLTGNAEYSLFVDPGEYYVMAYLDADLSFSRTAADPQIFWGAPGYPELVDVTGQAALNINLPLMIPPPVNLTLTPQGTPIVIPNGGGSFNYTITVANGGAEALATQIWFDATLPNGTLYPILGPVTLNLPAGYTGDRYRTQGVPGIAPAGTYSYAAHIGVYPAIVWVEDSFIFEKAGIDSRTGQNDWYVGGDDLGNEVAQSEEANPSAPETFGISNIYPNPFNPETVIQYQVPTSGDVLMTVHTIGGQRVFTLVGRWLEAGTHTANFDGTNLVSGVYLCSLRMGAKSDLAKMVLVK